MIGKKNQWRIHWLSTWVSMSYWWSRLLYYEERSRRRSSPFPTFTEIPLWNRFPKPGQFGDTLVSTRLSLPRRLRTRLKGSSQNWKLQYFTNLQILGNPTQLPNLLTTLKNKYSHCLSVDDVNRLLWNGPFTVMIFRTPRQLSHTKTLTLSRFKLKSETVNLVTLLTEIRVKETLEVSRVST